MQLPALKAEHEYRLCHDPDCPRFPCRIYKEGFEDGSAAGFAAGEAAGYAQGYSDAGSDAGR